jgi:hypothetical protein
MKNTKCERQLQVGDAVIFYDEYSRPHNALITAVWGERYLISCETESDLKFMGGIQEKIQEPSCNLLFVSSDEKKDDCYGRQIERRTSCVHAVSQMAPGFSWSWPEEKESIIARYHEERMKLHEAKVSS